MLRECDLTRLYPPGKGDGHVKHSSHSRLKSKQRAQRILHRDQSQQSDANCVRVEEVQRHPELHIHPCDSLFHRRWILVARAA
jgi:hypothetical protein